MNSKTEATKNRVSFHRNTILLAISFALSTFHLKTSAQCDGTPTMTDARDGNVYNIIQIDGSNGPYCLGTSQCWMSENLDAGSRVAPANNMNNAGSLAANQAVANIEKYCDGGINGSAVQGDCSTRGGLYQWDEAMAYTSSVGGNGPGPQGICPTGWHIPTDNEWKCMEMNLGMTQVQTDNTFWRGTSEGDQIKNVADCFGGVNCGISGFEAFPLGGTRSEDGLFWGGITGMTWWTASTNGTDPWRRHIEIGRATIARNASLKARGYAIRCVRDNAPIPLPVELLFFDAKWLDNNYQTVELNWETASEINNSHFEIERSLDGIHFEYLKTVDRIINNTQNNHYNSLDEDPYIEGISYYRLKQVDNNGDFEYSNIEALNVPEGLSFINLYPNPMVNNATVVLTSSQDNRVLIDITNSLGQKVKSLEKNITVGFNSFNLDASKLDAGNYFIEISTSSGLYKVEREFIKSNK